MPILQLWFTLPNLNPKLPLQFECCGLTSPQDWVLSSCDCLPESCCKPEKYEVCRNAVSYNNTGALRNLSAQRSEIFDAAYTNEEDRFYWNSGCQLKIMNVLAQIGKSTVTFAAYLFTVHLILTIWMSHIIQMIFHLFDSREGYAQLQVN